MAESGRTHAIVVGIESYLIGSDWNLAGPASDALDCAEWWLRGCNVPAANITLLLSPLAEYCSEIKARANLLGFAANAVLDATLANVENAFDAVELIEDGQLLLVFWAGHGIIDRADQRMLFTADATEQTRRALPINQRLLQLTDRKVKGFTEQVIVVDACANFLETMQWDAEPFASGLTKLNRRAEVRQAIIFGAMAGQTAAADPAQRHGKFSRFVLTEMKKSGTALPPDMDMIARTAIAHFEKLNANDPSAQRPVYIRVRGFDQLEDEAYGERPMSAAVQVAAQNANLTPRQLARLFDALEHCSQIETREQRDALAAAVLPAGADVDRSPERAEDTEGCLRAIARHNKLTAMCDWLGGDQRLQSEQLAAYGIRRQYNIMKMANQIRARLGALVLTTPGVTTAFFAATGDRYGVSPPEGVVHALERLLSEPDDAGVSRVGRFLIQLEHDSPGNVKVAAELLEEVGVTNAKANEIRQAVTSAGGRRPRLLVDLHGHDRMLDDTSWPDTLRAWLQNVDGEWGPYREQASDGTAAGVERALDKLVNWGWKKAQREPVIELIVPRCLMANAFETWKVAEPMAQPRQVGIRHPLVLRWGERFWIEDLQLRWRYRSEQVRAALKATDPKIRWVGSAAAADPDLLQTFIEGDLTSHCIGLEFALEPTPPDLKQDPLVAMLRAGVAYALWFRDLPANLEALKIAVHLLLVSDSIDDFPESLQRMRAQPTVEQIELAKQLAVLWDDPNNLPPRNWSREP